MSLRGEGGDGPFLGYFLEVLLLELCEGEEDGDWALPLGVTERPFLAGLSEGDRIFL